MMEGFGKGGGEEQANVCLGGLICLTLAGVVPNNSSNCKYFTFFSVNATRFSLFAVFIAYTGFASLKLS